MASFLGFSAIFALVAIPALVGFKVAAWIYKRQIEHLKLILCGHGGAASITHQIAVGGGSVRDEPYADNRSGTPLYRYTKNYMPVLLDEGDLPFDLEKTVFIRKYGYMRFYGLTECQYTAAVAILDTKMPQAEINSLQLSDAHRAQNAASHAMFTK